MEVEKNEWKALKRAIDDWEQEGKISHDQAGELRKSVQLKRNERQQIAQYFFLVAISCTILAFGAIFIDEKLLEKIKSYFALSNIVIALISAVLGALWFGFVKKRRQQYSIPAYEVYMVLGGLISLTSLVYICKDTGFGASHNGFLLAAFAMLLAEAIFLHSRALWIGAILAFMGWFGAFSTWQSTDNLFLGMNYPMRFTVFGVLVIALAWLQSRVARLSFTQRITYLAGLIIFFTGLWGVSIFGNFGSLDEWSKVRQTYVLAYSVVFGLTAAGAFYYGIKYRDDATRDFGVFFLILNLYSRYFEFFWDSMNKGLFFLMLGVSFWFIGRQVEKRKKRHGVRKPVV
ncbi:DUF2157 domain-containing protein [Polluticoccus soli]|uniref:DUF2157 domain-containing protein n=1 Tax=Polluticoccus soli TaxID=3034150 RepID=UPI0023E1B3B1|nr:DUF2157 domain-containing protein [Flavipsychrobacter sp. JY13-12]